MVRRMLVGYWQIMWFRHGPYIGMVMGLIDEEDDWNGPKYVAEHVYNIEHLMGSQLIDDMTGFDGKKAF